MNNLGNPMLGSGVGVGVGVDKGHDALVLNSDMVNDDPQFVIGHVNELGENFAYCEQPVYANPPVALDDIDIIIDEMRVPQNNDDIEFNVVEKLNSRSTTYEMADGVLFAMPEKEIAMEVSGVHSDQFARISLRYTEGVHHNTPVHSCSDTKHANPSRPGCPFSIPKLHVNEKFDNGHMVAEIPVTASPTGSFQFSVVHYCLNSCHAQYGKLQEMRLQLCDQWGHVLKEKEIELRICKNVNRDKRGKQALKATSKRSAGKGKNGGVKKVKVEVDEPVKQEGASAVMPFPFIFSGSTYAQVKLPTAFYPTFVEYLRVIGGEVLEKWDVDEQSAVVLPNP